MGLFGQKNCDICGEKIGFLGNRKLEDGNLCKHCARKLSPFFRGRRRSTVEKIREHLAYREKNAQELESFRPDIVFGTDEKIYLDSAQKKLIVTSADDYREENPDIIDAEQIISCETEIEDNAEELFFTDKDGSEKSYNPPRYRYAYAFYITLKIDSPWFDEICVDLNPDNRPESKEDDLYAEWQMRVLDLKSMIHRWTYKPRPEDVLLGPIPGYFDALRRKQAESGGMKVDDVAEPVVIPEESWQCFHCRQINAGKFCTECGSPRPTNEKE